MSGVKFFPRPWPLPVETSHENQWCLIVTWQDRIYVMIGLQTFGSSPNCANCTSLSRLRAVLMMSLHFLGVSSTLPAKKRQQAPVTWGKRKLINVFRFRVWCDWVEAATNLHIHWFAYTKWRKGVQLHSNHFKMKWRNYFHRKMFKYVLIIKDNF